MIERGESENRDMLPRWLPLRKALGTGEFSSAESSIKDEAKVLQLRGLQQRAEAAFQAAERNWIRTPDEIAAQELLAAAVIFDRRDGAVQDAARLLIEHCDLLPAMRSIILAALGEAATVTGKAVGQFSAETYAAIGQHKRRLQFNPNDALSAAEMALYYSYLGQLSQSRQALERAIMQAPNNRYVLRAMSRLAAHENDPELGLYYLRKSPRSDVDPWLVSAKLALARNAGIAPMRWRQSQHIANSDGYSPRSISELSAQLATLSADAGSRKQAIRFLDRSAISPTENAVAQLEHVNRKYSLGISERANRNDLPESDEATAHRMLSLGQVSRAVEACGSWSELEPFSAEPAVLGSFLACISGGTIDQGIRLLDCALISNPSDETLLNNKAVLLSLADQPREALEVLSHCRPASLDGDPTYWATTGLVAMRSGHFDEGISHYEKAISIAKEERKPLVALRAFLFMGREMIRFDPSVAGVVSKAAEASFKKLDHAKVRVPIDLTLLGEVIEGVAKNPPKTGYGTAVGPLIDPVDIEGFE